MLLAPIFFTDTGKETLTSNIGFLGNINPDKPILVHLRCLVDVCVFTCPTSAGCCVLLRAVGQFEEILFVVKVWLRGPVPGDSKAGE